MWQSVCCFLRSEDLEALKTHVDNCKNVLSDDGVPFLPTFVDDQRTVSFADFVSSTPVCPESSSDEGDESGDLIKKSDLFKIIIVLDLKRVFQ